MNECERSAPSAGRFFFFQRRRRRKGTTICARKRHLIEDTLNQNELQQTTQRIRIRFSKRGVARFISHHDLMRLFKRAVRRAELPVRMSQGFNPQPRIAFPAPLKLGWEGENEVVDLELQGWMPPAKVIEILARELPEGIRLRSGRVVGRSRPCAPLSLLYRIPLLPGAGITDKDVAELLGKTSISLERTRKGKARTLDVRTALGGMTLSDGVLTMDIRFDPQGTPSPEDVLHILNLEAGRDYETGAIARAFVRMDDAD
ncbi:MAG TPA: TIGR03936 family radical SAM-associated protein [Candidatus Brocadiia bacterium]|nr:TIGR03936 family radical SAM-associated protein [Candidatus Brocadiia bacterium]